jgi:chemotaxis protein CheC
MNATTALDARQTDALTELINIAFGLTASKLSEISNSRIVIDAPIVSIHPIEEVASEMGLLESGDVVAVHQAFTGEISGDAMLFLDHYGAVRLSNLLIEDILPSNSLDTAKGEILTEIGNMLLGACLGVFGNLLEVRISFAVPVLHLESLKPLLTTLSIAGEVRHAVVIATSFSIQEQEVSGQLAIALSTSSLERLIQAVDVWEGSHCSA